MSVTVSTDCSSTPSFFTASQWSVITSTGRIYAFWMDSIPSATKWAYSDNGGLTWSGEAFIGVGIVLPHVCIDGTDNIYMISTDTMGALVLNKWNGAVWGANEVVAANFDYIKGATIACDPAGNCRVSWTTTGGQIQVRHRSSLGIWGAPQTLTVSGTCRNPFLYYAGTLWSLYYDDTGTGTIWYTTDTGGGWASVADKTWTGARPTIVELSTGEWAIAYDRDGSQPRDILFRETTSYLWGPELTLGNSTIAFGASIGRNAVDDIVVVIDNRVTSTSHTLKYFSRPHDSTTWTEIEIATGLGSTGFFCYATHLVNSRTGEGTFCLYPDDSMSSLLLESLSVGPDVVPSVPIIGERALPLVFDSIEKIGAWTWRYTWSGTAPFQVYKDGELLATTSETEYIIEEYEAFDEPPILEVLDANVQGAV